VRKVRLSFNGKFKVGSCLIDKKPSAEIPRAFDANNHRKVYQFSVAGLQMRIPFEVATQFRCNPP